MESFELPKQDLYVQLPERAFASNFQPDNVSVNVRADISAVALGAGIGDGGAAPSNEPLGAPLGGGVSGASVASRRSRTMPPDWRCGRIGASSRGVSASAKTGRKNAPRPCRVSVMGSVMLRKLHPLSWRFKLTPSDGTVPGR